MRLSKIMLNRDTNLNSFSQVTEMPDVLRCVWYSCIFFTRDYRLCTCENIALMITREINVYRTPTFNIYSQYNNFFHTSTFLFICEVQSTRHRIRKTIWHDVSLHSICKMHCKLTNAVGSQRLIYNFINIMRII